MALPISYNFRNLIVRRTTTLMTALGIGLTVAVLLADLALVNGLRDAFRSTGDPLNILVLRKGGTSELVSAVTREVYQQLKFKPGIARDHKGDPMASLEMVTIVSLPNGLDSRGSNITLRGILPLGFELRDVRLQQGRWFQQGQREIVVGRLIAERYNTGIGKQLRFGKGLWTVVGIMDGGGSAVNSEIWGDLNQVASDFNRENGLSSVLVRAADLATVPALINSINDDQRLNMTARTEKEYYETQTISGAPIEYLGIFVSIIMAVGSSFAAMNTMYAAVARRAREIGTLRVLGFSKSTILFSFFVESLLLAVIGALLGIALVLPLNNISTSIGSFVTFSEISFNFHVGPAVMAWGIVFALLMGALGGLFPARSAARKEILTALREV
ncbi:MAG TPA: ABC transporter permease [Bryobacteraceae bacterium]|jgi:putative ABC transport system permease protein|nr:ABC transporter permease [Bryobacteraceae bacterium]